MEVKRLQAATNYLESAGRLQKQHGLKLLLERLNPLQGTTSENVYSFQVIFVNLKLVYVYLCVCVCVCVFVCVCVCVCMYICIYVCLYVCVYVYMCVCMSGWIFQKVLAEIVQKGLILSQKRLISNCRNFGLLAPKSMRFPSKDSKLKDLSFK